MKNLEVPLLSDVDQTSSIKEISSYLDKHPRHMIAFAPWPAFSYVPKVQFCMAHNNDCILLKYYVEEEVLKAVYCKPDDPVYKDSCVEFFISFDDEGYYNLEWNAIGTCKLNFGKARHDRAVVAEQLVQNINYLSLIQNTSEGVRWELTLQLPVQVFFKHELVSLSGRECRANFYKCGDDLPTPHFLCWNRIESPAPDFHLPDGFGKIYFL